MTQPTYPGQPMPQVPYQPPGQPAYPMPYQPPGQQFGTPPATYVPQQPPRQPQKWTGSADEAFGGESRSAISWEQSRGVSVPVGTRRLLLVESGPDVSHGRNFSTGELEYWPDGNPKWKITVQVVDENGEDYGLWMSKPSAMGAAIADAEKIAGFKIAATPWCALDITYIGDRPAKDPRANPAKQFRVVLIPPQAALSVMTQPQRQAMDAKRTPTPELPAQDGAPVYGVPQAPVPDGQPAYNAPQASAPVYGVPQAPPQRPLGQGMPRTYGPAGDLTPEILVMFYPMTDDQIRLLGRDPAVIRQAIERATADGVLPPF
jgi:hypothetical protein